MSPKIIKMIEDIAGKQNLPTDVVEKIFFSQFQFCSKVMNEGIKNIVETFSSIQILYLGKFMVRKHNIMKLAKKAKEEQKRIENGKQSI